MCCVIIHKTIPPLTTSHTAECVGMRWNIQTDMTPAPQQFVLNVIISLMSKLRCYKWRQKLGMLQPGVNRLKLQIYFLLWEGSRFAV